MSHPTPHNLPPHNPNRRAAWLVVTVIALATILGASGHAQQQPLGVNVGAAANQAIVTHLASQPGRAHQLVVVDTQNKSVAVYQIDPDSGEISLTSVRNMTWDLQMEEFNSEKQLPPKDIRAALQESR